MAGMLSNWVRHQPAPDVEYTQALRVEDPSFSGIRQIFLGIGGAMLGLLLLAYVPSSVRLFILWLTFLGSGSGDWAAYSDSASSFAIPAGMAATQLGAATMIAVCIGLVFFLHRFQPRWLHSVQPGFRWRYALVALGAAALIIGGVWALSRIGQPWTFKPEAEAGWYLAIVIFITPLQAAGEEYFFRGYLMQAISLTAVDFRHGDQPVSQQRAGAAQWLARQYPTWAPVVGSALIFALLHPTPNVEAFLYPLAFGLVAGWLVVKTGGLEASIAAHVVNNVITFGFATLTGTVSQVYVTRSVEWPELALVVGSFAAFGLAAVWLARRMKLATRTPASRFGH